MKFFLPALLLTFFLSTVASLSAGDVIFYGGTQKPGKLKYTSATAIPSDLLKGDFGGTFGIRLSTGRRIGFEQNFSYSPRFAKQGSKHFKWIPT
jgi:hypothetical protein